MSPATPPARPIWSAAASARSPRRRWTSTARSSPRARRKKSGLKRAEADAIWDALMGFARYGFNRAHAADYAVIVAQTALPQGLLPGRVHGRAVDDRAARHREDRPADRRVPAHGHRGAAAQRQRQQHNFTVEQLPARRAGRPAADDRFPFPVEPARPSAWGWMRSRTSARGRSRSLLQGPRDTPLRLAGRFRRPGRPAPGQPPRASNAWLTQPRCVRSLKSRHKPVFVELTDPDHGMIGW